MTEAEKAIITSLFIRFSHGDKQALNELFAMEIVDREVRRRARRLLRSRRPGQTGVQTDDLVQDLFVKFFGAKSVKLPDRPARAYFYWLVTQRMRNILSDYAKKRLSERRGGGAKHEPLEEVETRQEQHMGSPFDRLVKIDELMCSLTMESERQAQIVDLHDFGGYNFAAIAEMLDVSEAAVKSEYQAALKWLQKHWK